EPLDPNMTYDQTRDIPGVPPTGIYHVEQITNWETAAVKRIEQISMGSLAGGDCSQSHRLFDTGLKSLKPPANAPESNKSGPPGGGGGDTPSGQMGGMKMQGGGGMNTKGGKEEGKKTKNGLSAERYAEQPTPELRRVPFGISLIIGQEHIDRVLYAFSKSRLRILMT